MQILRRFRPPAADGGCVTLILIRLIITCDGGDLALPVGEASRFVRPPCVVVGSPDPTTRPDRRSPVSPGDLRSARVTRSGDSATTSFAGVAADEAGRFA